MNLFFRFQDRKLVDNFQLQTFEKYSSRTSVNYFSRQFESAKDVFSHFDDFMEMAKVDMSLPFQVANDGEVLHLLKSDRSKFAGESWHRGF